MPRGQGSHLPAVITAVVGGGPDGHLQTWIRHKQHPDPSPDGRDGKGSTNQPAALLLRSEFRGAAARLITVL